MILRFYETRGWFSAGGRFPSWQRCGCWQPRGKLRVGGMRRSPQGCSGVTARRSGRANESATRVLHTERPKTLPSIGLWVTTPLKRLLQLLLHRALPAAAAALGRLPRDPTGGSRDGSAPTDTPGVLSHLPRMMGKEEAVPMPVPSSACVSPAGATPRLGLWWHRGSGPGRRAGPSGSAGSGRIRVSRWGQREAGPLSRQD